MEQTQFSSSTPSSSNTSFLVLALSILGILAISLLLLLYYLFITKCCQLSWYRYSTSIVSRRRSQYNNNPTLQSTSVIERRGLDEFSIQSIPTIRYKKNGDKISFHECAVCINEFREDERIRLLPNCFHVFHLDCIDTWLQSNANCPLCRAPITCCPMAMAHLVGPYGQEGANDNNNDIVIHVRDHELSVNDERKLKNVGSMGDECINSRNKEDLFDIVPMRRSFSMDSSSDRQLYIAVQNILHGSSQTRRDIPVRENNGDENNVPGKLRRGFFSFNQNRPSRSAVLPI